MGVCLAVVNKTNVKSGFVTSLKALLLSLVVCGFIIAAVGYNPIQAYYYLGVGAFGSFREISNTLANSIPLIFTGLSVAVASRAGLLNIGAEGQLYIGAMCGTVCALYAPISNHLMMIVAVLISSMVGGMLWGAVPCLLYTSDAADE